MSDSMDLTKKIQDFLTIQEVADHLIIDYIDELVIRKLTRFILVVDSYLKGSVHKNYPKTDERIKELALLIIDDLYDRQSNIIKENSNIRKLKDNIALQIKMEMRNNQSTINDSQEGDLND